jgi:hypothetical protein
MKTSTADSTEIVEQVLAETSSVGVFVEIKFNEALCTPYTLPSARIIAQIELS